MLLGQGLDLTALEPRVGRLAMLVLLGFGLTGRAKPQRDDEQRSCHRCHLLPGGVSKPEGDVSALHPQQRDRTPARASPEPPRTATVKPGWQWTTDSVFRVTNAVRAGRSLQPQRWPNNARVAVLLSFDADHETVS